MYATVEAAKGLQIDQIGPRYEALLILFSGNDVHNIYKTYKKHCQVPSPQQVAQLLVERIHKECAEIVNLCRTAVRYFFCQLLPPFPLFIHADKKQKVPCATMKLLIL